MGIVLGKESHDLYSAFFIPDSVNRKVALERWVDDTSSSIQDAVKEELQSIVELITENRWTEDGWRTGVRKLRGLRGKYHVVLDIKLRPENSKDKYHGIRPEQIIQKNEIDLHEKKVHEAIPLVDQYLKESYDACLERVRIIHGKGIGVLRQAVRDHLQNHRLVESFTSAAKDHGGDGATDVVLKDVVTD